MADLGYAFGLPPEDALRYFEGLGYTVPADWQPAWNEAQAKARAIAGIHRQDVAAQFHGALYDAMAAGKPFEAWRDDVGKWLAAHDWQLQRDGDIVDKTTGEVVGKNITKTRLETIYRTQTQAAYMAGKWQTFQAERDTAPYLQYSAVLDSRTRKSHEALHGAVYHIDDAFWDYFYPPNGFNCRCTVRAFSEDEAKARGLEMRRAEFEDTHLVINKKGDTRPVKALKLPDGRLFAADKGFEGNVGKNHLANLGQLQMQRAVELPPKLAAVAVGEAMKDPAFVRAVAEQFERRFDYLKNNNGTNQVLHVGILPLPVLNALEQRGIMPKSAVISMGDADITHALRESKTKRGQALPEEVVRKIPEMLPEPDAVYLQSDKAKPVLWFVYETAKGKLVLQIDKPDKKSKEIMNIVRTGGKIFSWNAAVKQHILIWGKELRD